MKHTPGPWKVMGNEEDGYTIAGCDEAEQAQEPIVWEMGGIDWEPNAHLIAAAPELLDTCEALADFTRDLLKLVTPEQIKAARLTTRMLKLNDQGFKALAKARGEK